MKIKCLLYGHNWDRQMVGGKSIYPFHSEKGSKCI